MESYARATRGQRAEVVPGKGPQLRFSKRVAFGLSWGVGGVAKERTVLAPEVFPATDSDFHTMQELGTIRTTLEREHATPHPINGKGAL